MPPKETQSAATLSQRLLKVVRTAQFFWFFGHFITVSHSILYILYSRFTDGGPGIYLRAYYGTLLSYGIIIYKTHGTPQANLQYVQKIFMDENTQYLLLALIWLTSSPLWVTLIPFLTFSLFHMLSYFRQEILPAVFPKIAGGAPTIADKISPVIQQFVQQYQKEAVRLVAYSEVWMILPFLVVSVFLRYVSILTPFLFCHFLRYRYFFSVQTQEAFTILDTRVTGFIMGNPSIPPVIKNGYNTVREMIVKYGAMNGAQPPQ